MSTERTDRLWTPGGRPRVGGFSAQQTCSPMFSPEETPRHEYLIVVDTIYSCAAVSLSRFNSAEQGKSCRRLHQVERVAFWLHSGAVWGRVPWRGDRRQETPHGAQDPECGRVRLGLISADLDVYGDTSAPSRELCWRHECTAPATGAFLLYESIGSLRKMWKRKGLTESYSQGFISVSKAA